MFVKNIIVSGVGASRGRRLFCLRTTCDCQGCLYEDQRMRSEALRYRLITEVRASSGLGNLAETSGFYGADFFRALKTTTEPVVLTRAPDVISA
ncbi:hypothetical protein Enr17x_35970 [Gimesia fumaroli]|uniref:Uncharacterized protein n=1 Tax=Gimesia fumaroli TaxID=2527976 RepID=A0A518IEK9_9PLAN|nr:hypothetical protein Enr17x_35970 [Gimesia fumaroli]